MECPNGMMPDFIWDEAWDRPVMERFRPYWRLPNTPEEVKLYKDINFKIQQLLDLMADNDAKNDSPEKKPRAKKKRKVRHVEIR